MTTYRAVLHQIQTYADRRFGGVAVPCTLVMTDVKEHTMNRNQIKGAAKNIAGKAQQKVGELTGDRAQQVKGIAKQVEGKVQRGAGNVERALDIARRKTR
jgi:uncharacterized protein YjbJ (UPF0337 family)